MIERRVKVAVIGGGIAGLTSAYLLLKKGIDVICLERETAPGGNIRTTKKDGFLLERGPYAFLSSSRWVWRLVKEVKLEDFLISSSPFSNQRFIFRNGKLELLPTGLISFLRSGFLSTSSKIRLLCEPFIKGGAKEQETAWEFFERRFGKEFTTFVASPFASGVYAGDLKSLGARSAFSKFWSFEKESGSMIIGAFNYMMRMKKEDKKEGLKKRSGLWSFKDGLGFITQYLGSELGDRLFLSFGVNSIEKLKDGIAIYGNNLKVICDAVIIATPPFESAQILRNSYPDAGSILASIPMPPVTIVQWSPPKEVENPFPEGFGFLIPPVYRFSSLGTIFYSDIFPSLFEDGNRKLYGTFVGGALNPDAGLLPEEKILGRVLSEHEIFLGKEIRKPLFVNIAKFPRAIAQLLPDHNEKIEKVMEILERNERVFLAGGYIRGVGMDSAIESAFEVVDKVMKSLKIVF